MKPGSLLLEFQETVDKEVQPPARCQAVNIWSLTYAPPDPPVIFFQVKNDLVECIV